MKPVAVVGGGISGLTAAFRLHQLGVPVVLYEKQERTGGVIRSGRQHGFLTESGPTSIRSTALVNQVVTELGLDACKVIANSNAKTRYLVRDGRLVRVPGSPISAVTTSLLSMKGKLRLLAEPFISRGGEDEQNLGDFVTRRLGREVLEYAVDPLVGGMYAGRPEQLSVKYAFPKLYDLERRSGSIFLGALSKAFSGKREPRVPSTPFSFSEGVQLLTDTLHAKLDGSVRVNSAVTAVIEIEGGWRISDVSGTVAEHSAVILAAPAPDIAKLQLSTKAGINLAPLAKIRYSGVVRIMFGFERKQMQRRLEGFGFLVPRSEKFHLLGSVFCSSVYDGSAPKDHVSFLCFLGGARSPELLNMEEGALSNLALGDLQQLAGIKGPPMFQSYLKMPQAIPQYESGHGEVCAVMNHAEDSAKGLYFAGNYRAGISVSDALASGWKAADHAGGVERV